MGNLLIPIDIVVCGKDPRYLEECLRGFELAFDNIYEKREINRMIYPTYHYWRSDDDDKAVKEVLSKDTNMVILALSSEKIRQLNNQLETKRQCIAMAPLSSDPELPTQIKNLKNCFFLCPPCTQEAKVLAQHAIHSQLKIKEGRLFGSSCEAWYVDFFKRAFELELGEEPLISIKSVGEIKAKLVKWILLLGDSKKWDNVETIRAKFPNLIILSTSSLEDHRKSQNRMSLGKKDTIFYSYFHVTNSFQKNFRSAFGYYPHIISVLCYDCMKIIAECIKKSGAYDSPTLKWMLKRERFEDCATGGIIFDENGRAIRSNLITKKLPLVFIKTIREDKKGILNYERLEALEEEKNEE